MYQAILFDLDGVLLDSEWLSFRIWKQYLWEHAHYRLTREEYAQACGGTPEIFSKVMEKFPVKKEDLDQYWQEQIYQRFQQENPPIMPGLETLMSSLKDFSGRKAIVTSSYGTWLQNYLDRFNLENTFDAIFSGDQVQNKKPDPELYILACKTLSVEPEKCLAVEDSLYGVLAAQQAKVPVLHMQGVPVLPAQIESKCVGTVNHLLQVLPYLQLDSGPSGPHT